MKSRSIRRALLSQGALSWQRRMKYFGRGPFVAGENCGQADTWPWRALKKPNQYVVSDSFAGGGDGGFRSDTGVDACRGESGERLTGVQLCRQCFPLLHPTLQLGAADTHRLHHAAALLRAFVIR